MAATIRTVVTTENADGKAAPDANKRSKFNDQLRGGPRAVRGAAGPAGAARPASPGS
jgi:hypothetical protein